MIQGLYSQCRLFMFSCSRYLQPGLSMGCRLSYSIKVEAFQFYQDMFRADHFHNVVEINLENLWWRNNNFYFLSQNPNHFAEIAFFRLYQVSYHKSKRKYQVGWIICYSQKQSRNQEVSFYLGGQNLTTPQDVARPPPNGAYRKYEEEGK